MWAILSDVHGNLEALQAVLADATSCGADRIFCLGDTVGYGPDPLECVTLSMSWPVVLQGNFEQAVLSDDDLSGWTALAAADSVFWCRRLLIQMPTGHQVRAYLAERPRTHEMNGLCLVHGTPHSPLYEYLIPQDVDNARKMRRLAASITHGCFNGHTHVPGVFIEIGQGTWHYVSPDQAGKAYELDRCKWICNVGSVGQPRDGDWRASYVLFDGEFVRFRRVEYDVELTIAKIQANPELADFLGERLRDGR